MEVVEVIAYMLFEIDQYHLDIDVPKTRQFYKTADVVSKLCLCDGCLNFADVDGTLLYGGFYHVCSILLDGTSAWKKLNENTSYWDKEASFPVSSDFFISFQKDIALLEKGFPLPVIQLEFSARIPWVLEKRNPYQ